MSTEDMIQIDSSRFLAATRNASYIYNKATDISEELRLDKDSPLIFYSSCKDVDNEDETRLRTDEGDDSFSGGHRRAKRNYPNRQGEVKSFFRQGCAENDGNSRNFFLFLHVGW